jgi:hypothetical protein
MIAKSGLLLRLWLVLALASTAFAQALQLADGRLLLATVTEASGDGLRLKRLDNGGVLDLRWEHLSLASADAWKRKLNLLGDSQDELLTRADELEYLREGTRQSVIGRLVERTPDHYVVMVKGQGIRVPVRDVVAVRKVDAPVMQIFTKDEFYNDRLTAQPPGDNADLHVLLAEDLLRVADFDRAAEHLQKAKGFGNSRNPGQIDALLGKVERFKAAQKEFGLLAEIAAARSRGGLADFERGTKLIGQFEKDFPATKAKAEFDAEKKKFAAARTKFLTQQIADLWRRSIQTIADKKVSDTAVTLDQARDYAQSKMTDDLVARVAGLLKLEPDEVKALWGGRKETFVGKRPEQFTYGIGSWVLGLEAIQKDTVVQKQGKDKTALSDPNNQNVARFTRALREAMERRRQQMQADAGAEEETPERWWQRAERQERANWLRAYYAEFGGQLTVTFASLTPCVSCSGAGTTIDFNGQGERVVLPCFLCHKTKWVRSFKAY